MLQEGGGSARTEGTSCWVCGGSVTSAKGSRGSPFTSAGNSVPPSRPAPSLPLALQLAAFSSLASSRGRRCCGHDETFPAAGYEIYGSFHIVSKARGASGKRTTERQGGGCGGEEGDQWALW